MLNAKVVVRAETRIVKQKDMKLLKEMMVNSHSKHMIFILSFIIFIPACMQKNYDYKAEAEDTNNLIVEHNRQLFSVGKTSYINGFSCKKEDFVQLPSKKKPLKKVKVQKDKEAIAILNKIMGEISLDNKIKTLSQYLDVFKIYEKGLDVNSDKFNCSYSQGYLNIFIEIDKEKRCFDLFMDTSRVGCKQPNENIDSGFTNFFYLENFVEEINFKFDEVNINLGVSIKVFHDD